jgi:UDP-N-acetylglucosamine--N-acetylmuramyl-(pentapeptide) pyrophosphoryl-undecaprenol N-acetylglucosamine transferase
MKVLVVGGGSGGHITPAVAVVRKLLELHPRTKVEFWTDRKYYDNVVKITTEIGVRWGDEEKQSGKTQYIRVRKIAAGKFHRYAGWKLKDYFDNFSITIKDLVWGNVCGFVGFVCGVLQAFLRLVAKSTRPDVIFLKGGFVGLPVGMVAKVLKIPYVIHESDAVPGLANRMLMKQASAVAVSMPPAQSMDTDKCVLTGTPVAPEFRVVSTREQKHLKRAAGFDPERPLVIVTGGSQGSLHINEAMREILPELLKFTSVGLIAGRKHYEDMVDLKKYETWDEAKLQSNFRLWNFSSVMNELMGAADVVVSRAGATTIAELAALKKAVVLVPFEKLPGGHQVKNAEQLAATNAAEVVVDERMVQQPGMLLEAIKGLIKDPKRREVLATNLHENSKLDAAEQLAKIIIEVAGR